MGLKRAGWIVLAALLLASGFAAIFVAPERMPAPGVEATNWLAATSLAMDGDLAFTAADEGRFRDRFGKAPSGVRLAGDDRHLDAAPLAARAWASASRAAPRRGPHALNWILFAIALLVAARVLSAALGGSAPLWIALAAFGSVAFRSVHQLLPELHALLGVVVAAALVWGRRARLEKGPEQIYAGDLPSEASIWRWPFAGLALGAAAIRSPIYLLLALPMAVDLPRPRRGVAACLFVLGLAAPLAFVAAVASLPWAPPDLIATPALLGWNTLYAFVGRSAGLLVWYPALVALLAFARRRGAVPDGRAWLPHVALVAVLLQIALHPFDWAGDRIAAGSVWFLPIYGVLWFALDPAAADARRAIGSAIAVALVGGVALLPLWLHPTVPIPAAPARIGQVVGAARSYLPSESSLREIPGAIEIRRGEIRLRTDDPAIGAAGDRLVWAGSRRASVEVASDRPLGSIRFELGERAPSSIEIQGGEAGETTFRPGGELAIDVRVREASRRHPLWWSRGGASIYHLRLVLPQPAGEPIQFDLAGARPAGVTPAPVVKP